MNVAFIPVRGGSKSIPLKNIKQICGKPLVYFTVKAACGCRYIDMVYVSTDSEKIKETVEAFKTGMEADLFSKVVVIGRSGESASDSAPTEQAMLEFAEEYEFDNIVLIQATSPLLGNDDLNRGFEAFAGKGTDSVLSVVRQKRFHWEKDAHGFVHPVNYDVFHRPRRQEFEGYFVENGAFYITSKEALTRYGNRVSGKMKAVEMNEDTFFEIDEESDWVIIEALMKKNGILNGQENASENTDASFTISLKSDSEDELINDSEDDLKDELKDELKVNPKDDFVYLLENAVPQVRMFLTDCDGCLTDGGMYYSENGDELKKFNTRDGMGFALLCQKGILTGIITSEDMDLNSRRAKKLKLDIMESGCKDKADAVRKYCQKYGVALENVAYIGDDINDLEVIKMVGFGCCPADAMPQVREAAKYVTKACGGQGVIREAAEMLLECERC